MGHSFFPFENMTSHNLGKSTEILSYLHYFNPDRVINYVEPANDDVIMLSNYL